MKLILHFSSVSQFYDVLNPFNSAEIIYKIKIIKERIKKKNEFVHKYEELNENKTFKENLFAITKYLEVSLNDFFKFFDSKTIIKIISLILVINPETDKLLQKYYINYFSKIINSDKFEWSESSFLFIISWFDGLILLFDMCTDFLLDMFNPKNELFSSINDIFEPDFCSSNLKSVL